MDTCQRPGEDPSTARALQPDRVHVTGDGGVCQHPFLSAQHLQLRQKGTAALTPAGAFWTKARPLQHASLMRKMSAGPRERRRPSPPGPRSCPRKNLRVAGEPLAPGTFHELSFTGLPGPERSCFLSFAVVKRLRRWAVYFASTCAQHRGLSSAFTG